MTEKGKLLSVKEVMEYLWVSRITLYRLVKNGVLVGHKVGGVWRFTEEDVSRMKLPEKDCFPPLAGLAFGGGIPILNLLGRHHSADETFKILITE